MPLLACGTWHAPLSRPPPSARTALPSNPKRRPVSFAERFDPREPKPSDAKLEVLVDGGGLGGLLCAVLAAQMQGRKRIRVYDERWAVKGNKVQWTKLDNRVVNIQSSTWSKLPEDLRQRLPFSEQWPLQRESPQSLGPPKSVLAADLQEAVLSLAQDTPSVELHVGSPSLDLLQEDPCHAVVCGQHLRERLGFPAATEELRSPRQVAALLEAEVDLAEATVLSTAQRRFALSAAGKWAVLSMVPADGEMGSTQELQDGPLWEEMKEGFRLFGLDPDTHVHDWVELEPDLGRRPRYFAQLKSFQAPEAQRVCLPHPWAFLVGEAAQLTNPWPGRALNACVKSAQLLSQHLKAVAQAIRAGYPIDESFSRDYGETLTRIQGQEESVHRRQCQAEQKSGWSLSTCLQNAMDASEPGDKAAFRRALKKSHQRLRESGHPEVDLAQTWKRLEGQLSARTLALFRASGSWLFDPPPREEQTETETAKEEPEMDEEKWKEMQAAARGTYNRGVRHLKSKDPIPAARSFRSAAEKGHSKAAYALGVMLLNGQGVKKDERAAAQFMNQAAQSGHVKAMYNLGLMLQHGIGLARDVEKASQWTLRAAEGGHRKALRSGNVKIFGAGPWLDYDPKEMGVERIVKEAECGNTHAQFKLGTMHYEGDHVELDKAKSGYWFMQAAQSGLPEAQYQISRMLFQGDGVETDEKYAFRFLKLAAEQGHPESMHNMGAKLYFGEGVDIDRREAASWFLKAAHKELPQAQNNIGWMLYTGDGVPMNMTEGVNWMEQAAAAGNEEAQQHLLSIRGTMVSGF